MAKLSPSQGKTQSATRSRPSFFSGLPPCEAQIWRFSPLDLKAEAVKLSTVKVVRSVGHGSVEIYPMKDTSEQISFLERTTNVEVRGEYAIHEWGNLRDVTG